MIPLSKERKKERERVNMMLQRLHQLLLYALCLFALVVFCAPAPSESRRVIFMAPPGIHRGQILATHGMEKPCQKCHMRDHRGNCRRIISYSSGVCPWAFQLRVSVVLIPSLSFFPFADGISCWSTRPNESTESRTLSETATNKHNNNNNNKNNAPSPYLFASTALFITSPSPHQLFFIFVSR